MASSIKEEEFGCHKAYLAALLQHCDNSSEFRRLCKIVTPRLLAQVLHIVRSRAAAEDIVQEVLLAVWQNAKDFNPARGDAMGWLCSIAKYRALDECRRAKVARRGDHEISEVNESLGPIWSAQMQLHLSIGLDSLREDQQKFLKMYFLDGLSHSQIAEMTRAPLGTVKSAIRRALMTLRRGLDPGGESSGK